MSECLIGQKFFVDINEILGFFLRRHLQRPHFLKGKLQELKLLLALDNQHGTELLLVSRRPAELMRPSRIGISVWPPLTSFHFLLWVITLLLGGDEESLRRVLTGKLHWHEHQSCGLVCCFVMGRAQRCCCRCTSAHLGVINRFGILTLV